MVAHNNKSIDKSSVLMMKERETIDYDLFGGIGLQYMFPVINSGSKVLCMVLGYFHALKIISKGSSVDLWRSVCW